MDSKNSSGGGMGILGVLQTIFIVLKCLGLIDWTWGQVFIPTLVSVCMAALVIVVVIAIAIIDQIKYHSNR